MYIYIKEIYINMQYWRKWSKISNNQKLQAFFWRFCCFSKIDNEFIVGQVHIVRWRILTNTIHINVIVCVWERICMSYFTKHQNSIVTKNDHKSPKHQKITATQSFLHTLLFKGRNITQCHCPPPVVWNLIRAALMESVFVLTSRQDPKGCWAAGRLPRSMPD